MESVIVRVVIGATLGVIIGAALGTVSSTRSPGKRAALLAVVLGILMAGVPPALVARLADRLRTPSGRTPFQKYKEEVALIVRASPIVREWAAKRGSAVDVVAAVQQMGAKGINRMPDARVVRLAVLGGRMLGGLSDEECIRFAGGKGSSRDQEKLFAPLDDQQVAEVAEAYVAALEAEVADDPPTIVPSDASIDAAVKALTALDRAGVEKYVAPAADPNAPPAAKCRMLQYVYQKIEAVPEQHRATLARAVRMSRLSAARSLRAIPAPQDGRDGRNRE
jgi:hypothetical protein